MQIKKRYTRKFLGKIGDFIDNVERQFEKKHLKAYIKGHTRFADGYELNAEGKPIIDYLKDGTAERRRKYYDVKQEIISL